MARLVEEAGKLPGADGMLQCLHGLGFDLANPFPRDREERRTWADERANRPAARILHNVFFTAAAVRGGEYSWPLGQISNFPLID